MITSDELRLIINNLGEPLTEEKAMNAEADLGGDGKKELCIVQKSNANQDERDVNPIRLGGGFHHIFGIR